jgi:hypothetical protein
MSLYKDASLVMIPSAYKDGKLYSIRPTDGSGDFTFSRGSNLAATRVDVNGLIEKGRENLLLQSNQFDTTWTKSVSITATSGQSDRDGGTDAWLLKRSDAAARYIQQSVSFSGVNTFSFYAKPESEDWIYWNSSSGNAYGYINVNNGTIGANVGALVISQKATSVGNGYYRVEAVVNATLTYLRLYPAIGDGTIVGSVTDAGVYIQDAQLEAGLVATDYIETGASTAQAGILEDMPRLDYSGSCPALLLEPQRGNSIYSSEYIDSWSKNEFSVNTNSAMSPEGVVNASKIIPSTNNIEHYIDRSGFSRTTNQYIAHSIYVKPDGYNYFSLSNAANRLIANFELIGEGSARYVSSNGTNFTNHSATIEAVGNGWYRCVLIGQALDSVASYMRISCGSSAYNSSAWNGVGDGTSGVLVYGAQVELNSSYPTSYIPTYGSSVTRTHDVSKITGANASDLVDIPQMTFFAEHYHDADNANTTILGIARNTSGGAYGDFYSFVMRSDGQYMIEVRSSNTNQAVVKSATMTTGNHKIAAVIEENNIRLFVDGVLQNTDTNANLPTGLNELYLSGYPDTTARYGTKKSFVIFPTALTDSECIALTTL